MKKIFFVITLCLLTIFVFGNISQCFAASSRKSEKPITKKENKKLLDSNKLKQMNVEELKDLISRGADVNIKDNEGKTPLFFLLTGKKTEEEMNIMVEKLKLLIAAGADVKVKNKNGYTPLHYATGGLGNSDLRTVSILVESGADVNAKTNGGITSINWAIDPKITSLLLQLGADPNITNNEGETTLGKAESQVDFWDTQILVCAGNGDATGVKKAKQFKKIYETKIKVLKTKCEELGIKLE